MRIVIAPDKFKDSIGAADAARSISAGARAAAEGADVIEFPMADGGEGTASILALMGGGELAEVNTVDPIGRPISALIGLLPDGTAVVEMAQASGLGLLSADERDPTVTSTFGTGLLISAAIDTGARRIIVGAGGSATVDAGLGALAALGLEVRGHSQDLIEPVGGEMVSVTMLETGGLDRRLKTDVSLVVACDVAAPLYGPLGAARRFAGQKGASPDQIQLLERGLKHVASIYAEVFGMEVAEDPGSGAAGGLPAGLLAAFGASLVNGFDLVAEMTGLDERLQGADLVITGEGAFDAESDKVTAGVARHARRLGVPVAIIAGQVGLSGPDLAETGACVLTNLDRLAGSVEESMRHPATYLERAGRETVEEWLKCSG